MNLIYTVQVLKSFIVLYLFFNQNITFLSLETRYKSFLL